MAFSKSGESERAHMFERIKKFFATAVLGYAVRRADADLVKKALAAGASPNGSVASGIFLEGGAALRKAALNLLASRLLSDEEERTSRVSSTYFPIVSPMRYALSHINTSTPDEEKNQNFIGIVSAVEQSASFRPDEYSIKVLSAEHAEFLGDQYYAELADKLAPGNAGWRYLFVGTPSELPVMQAALENDVVKMNSLLKLSPNLNLLFSKDNKLWISQAMQADSKDALTLLLKALHKNETYRTLARNQILSSSATFGDERNLQCLLDAGYDIFAPFQDSEEETSVKSPLMAALRSGNPQKSDSVRMLLRAINSRGLKSYPHDLDSHLALMANVLNKNDALDDAYSQTAESYATPLAAISAGHKDQKLLRLAQAFGYANQKNAYLELLEPEKRNVLEKYMPSGDRLNQDFIAYAEVASLAWNLQEHFRLSVWDEMESLDAYQERNQKYYDHFHGTLMAGMLAQKGPVQAAEELRVWKHSDTINFSEMIDFMTRVALLHKSTKPLNFNRFTIRLNS